MTQPEFSQTTRPQYPGTEFPNQYQDQDQAGQDISQQITSLFRDMKSTMKNFKIFYKKYLQPQENVQPQESTPQETYQNMPQRTQNMPATMQKPQQYENPQHEYYNQPSQPHQYENAESPQIKVHYENPEINYPKQKKKQKHNFSKGFKKKQFQDPNKPKAPLTPYFMFFQQNREILRKRYPQMGLAEIGALGGKIWRQLSENEKDNYRSRYQEQMREYRHKMRVYKTDDGYYSGGRPNQVSYPDVTEINDDQI